MSEHRRRVAERIRAYAGLDPPAWLLDARLREPAAALGLAEEEYLRRAADDGGEAGRLADLLRVGETRFFRHRAQVAALENRVLPERAREAQAESRPLRVWSAGCASGEEAWTMAMLLDAAAPPCGYEVLATDLSDEALVDARAGAYHAERAGDVPPRLAGRYLRQDGEGAERHVAAELRARVTFQRHNLLDARYPSGFDVILCRNVLIYFHGAERNEVIARLWGALRERGYLFLGYSESLRDQEELFEAVRDDEGVIYRKRMKPAMVSMPAGKSGRSSVGDISVVAGTSQNNTSNQSANQNAKQSSNVDANDVVTHALRGDYHDAERLNAELRPLLFARRAIVDLDGAVFLGEEAARVLQRATEAAPGLELKASRASVVRWLERHGLRR